MMVNLPLSPPGAKCSMLTFLGDTMSIPGKFFAGSRNKKPYLEIEAGERATPEVKFEA